MDTDTDRGPYRYGIDGRDRITSVDDNWLRFAQSNGAPELTAERVVGTSLWQHVHGEQLAAVYRNLFSVVRNQQQELTLPFRCDSPTLIRHMLMTLRGQAEAHIEFEVCLVRTEERAAVDWPGETPAAVSPENVPICSLCRRVWLDAHWVELTRAVVSARMASNPNPPQLQEAMCEDCKRTSDAATA